MRSSYMKAVAAGAALVLLTACGGGNGGNGGDGGDGGTAKTTVPTPPPPPAGGHAHGAEAPLGAVTVDGMKIEALQGHGALTAGALGHLVIKLPYSDSGATIVRAWIGTEDRSAALVGKGDYAAAHDDYDIHAEAPDPLPPGGAWWFEIEKPDGSTHVGSIGYLTVIPGG
ncbi:MAG: hypothetical protein GY715_15640 [Planctomycetes bacterium]|nr:hypothetical protein [Planctomycetota bacterium]